MLLRTDGTTVQMVDVASVSDVLALLNEGVNDLRALENSVSKDRTLGYLAGVFLKALEVSEFERRLEVVELALGLDGESQL